MASQKPRFCGAQNRMNSSEKIKDLNVVNATQSQKSVAVLASTHHNTEYYLEQTNIKVLENVQNIQIKNLGQVFEELGIQSKPKPYARSSDKALQVCSHDLKTHQSSVCTIPSESNVIYCKNLFLKDRCGQFFIVICQEEYIVDLKMLKKSLNAYRNLSFGDNEALHTILQLKPGEITPLAVMHESARDVRIAVHSQLSEMEPDVKFAFHPLCGQLQVELSYQELVTFVKHFGKAIEVITNDFKTYQGIENFGKTTKSNAEKAKQSSEQFSIGIKNQNFKLEQKVGIHSTIPDCLVDDVKSLESNQIRPCTFHDKKDLTGIAVKAIDGNITMSFSNVTKLDQPQKVLALEMSLQKDKNGLFDKQDCPGTEISQGRETERIFMEKKAVQHKNNLLKAGFLLRPTTQKPKLEKVEQECVKSHNRVFLSRKGKLRSFVQKNRSTMEFFIDAEACSKADFQRRTKYLTAALKNNVNTAEDQAVNYHSQKAVVAKDVENEFSVNTVSEINTNQVIKSFPTPQKDREKNPNNKSSRLEIIELFYTSLNNSGAIYAEIDLSNEGGDMLSPSVGCRCFLLKDENGDFFFVISHELYELDFGRLKAALRPKKKLGLAQPAEIITVLGTDPMKMSPFAVFTVRYPQLKVYITQKVMAPNLRLCIQHPFAQATRIMITSAHLQNYLKFLEIDFKHVEEKQWNPRYNFPFSQFDKAQGDSASTKSHSVPAITPINVDDIIHHPDLYCTQLHKFAKDIASHILTHLDYSLLLTIPLAVFASDTFPLFQFLPRFYRQSRPKIVESFLGLQGSSVDVSNVQESYSDTNFCAKMSSSTKIQLKNISVPMTTKDLENHLLSENITFEMNTKTKSSDINRCKHTTNKETTIIEHCSVMYLTSNKGHNFLIIGAKDDFPMSVKRFCRRNLIREHLDIRVDPQEEKDINFFDDIAPRMIPFALAFAKLKLMIWDRLKSLPRSSKAKQKTAQFLDRIEFSPVTVALTSTLYIDPETIMEFFIGHKGTMLHITASEFEKYCRQVGFEIIYY